MGMFSWLTSDTNESIPASGMTSRPDMAVVLMGFMK